MTAPTKRRSARQARAPQDEDRIPERLARLPRPRDQSGRPLRQYPACTEAIRTTRTVRNVRGVGRRFWLITPQTVNAYYNHANNELVVTAAILQPPVFNLEADDAVNYGAIGSMIGHELGHAFDLRGRLTDSRGRHPRLVGARGCHAVRLRTDMLDAQAARFEPVPGLHVNSELTWSRMSAT